ncbi:MAG: TolC family protein [Planctomycetota bacterium]
MRRRTMIAPLALLTLLAACRVTVDGEQAERDRAARAGADYARPFAERALPPLPSGAPLADWIAHALVANGEVEAAWHDWLVALEQVPQAASQDTTAMTGLEHRLDGGAALDRTGLMLMSDAMNNLLLPGRLEDRGRAALQRARAAAARFDRARLRLQREVAERYVALALHDREIALQERLRAVLAVAVPSLRARVGAGAAAQPELLDAEVALARAEAALARMHGDHPGMIARLRALVGADAGGGDEPRPALPAIAPLDDDEHEFVERALAASPELEVLRREHEARLAEVTAEEWNRVPGFQLRSTLMGDGVAVVAGALTLPFLRDDAVEAGVRAAQARAQAADALRRQATTDAVATTLAELAGLQAIAAEAALLRERVLPRQAQIADVARAQWSAGRAPFAQWAAAATMQLEVEVQLARLDAAFATGRARLAEALGGQLAGEIRP